MSAARPESTTVWVPPLLQQYLKFAPAPGRRRRPSRQPGMVDACREVFGVPVIVPPDPHLGAATGAALLGWQRLRKLPGAAVPA